MKHSKTQKFLVSLNAPEEKLLKIILLDYEYNWFSSVAVKFLKASIKYYTEKQLSYFENGSNIYKYWYKENLNIIAHYKIWNIIEASLQNWSWFITDITATFHALSIHLDQIMYPLKSSDKLLRFLKCVLSSALQTFIPISVISLQLSYPRSNKTLWDHYLAKFRERFWSCGGDCVIFLLISTKPLSVIWLHL